MNFSEREEKIEPEALDELKEEGESKRENEATLVWASSRVSDIQVCRVYVSVTEYI